MTLGHERRLGPLRSMIVFAVLVKSAYVLGQIVELFAARQAIDQAMATSALSTLVVLTALSYLFLADALRDLARPLADNLDITADNLELAALWVTIATATLVIIQTTASAYIDGGQVLGALAVLWAIAALETYRFENIQERIGATESDLREHFGVEAEQ